ncbi:MAG: glutamate 5-kinase [Parcubacteria group bacterium Gr01-1014_8]|nr:MAG: glutamate 5-kinase [Parcubacteria group bacterium Gr01-1014_8]
MKVGTGVVSKESGELDLNIFRHLVEQVVALRNKGMEVVIVTSGAVGAGKSVLTPKGINSEVIRKQVLAAVGQAKLMNIYADLFSKHGYLCAQVLTTKQDFRDEEHYANMKNCFKALLMDSVVPIVNENDVVATTELMFTDNDELAGLVATQLEADLFVILTTSDGILDSDKKTIPEINLSNSASVSGHITGEISAFGRGGMRSKFTIAKQLAKNGIAVYITNGKKKNALIHSIDGKAGGTYFAPVT